jgi:hypothetical protein
MIVIFKERAAKVHQISFHRKGTAKKMVVKQAFESMSSLHWMVRWIGIYALKSRQ